MTKNKNQQFKIAVVAVLVICLISSIIAAVRSSTSSPSESNSKVSGPASKTEDEAAVKELQKAVEDLETIKDRIKNAEEGYVAKTIDPKQITALQLLVR
jgi:hypothetical protein